MDNEKKFFSDEEMKAVLRFQKKQQLQQHWEKLAEEEDKAEIANKAKNMPKSSSKKQEE